MDFTQAELDTKIDAAVAKYGDKQVTYLGYAGECLSLIKQVYADVLGIPMPASGNGLGDGYYLDFPAPLSKYFTKAAFNENESYPKGTLIVYPVTHHITIVVGSTAGAATTEVFEQNANPDGSAAHLFNRENSGATPAEGVLIPIVQAPASVAAISVVGRTLHLSAKYNVRHIYPLGVAPVLQNALKATLDPAKFGGLSYAVLGNPYPNTYTIKTSDFGTVNIFASDDTTIS